MKKSNSLTIIFGTYDEMEGSGICNEKENTGTIWAWLKNIKGKATTLNQLKDVIRNKAPRESIQMQNQELDLNLLN